MSLEERLVGAAHCPGCAFVRRWNAVYRALWEAHDQYAVLYGDAEALGEEAGGVADPEGLARGMARAERSFADVREALDGLRRAVGCFAEDRPSPN
jgi:hypothetical protein